MTDTPDGHKTSAAMPTAGVAIIEVTAEGYEDVSSDLILEDFLANPRARWTVRLLNEPKASK